MIRSINPATGQVLACFEPHRDAQIDAALARADQAQRRWARTPRAERGALLRRVAAVLRARTPELARQITLEMGKPIIEAESEVHQSAWVCDFYADKAAELPDVERTAGSARGHHPLPDPAGVLLAIMPWSDPVWRVVRCAAAALAAGNTMLLKHADNVPRCALELQAVFHAAAIDPGLFTALLLDSAQLESLLNDPRVAALALTGPAPLGRPAPTHTRAELRREALELGGSDPCIVLADADLEAAVRAIVKACSRNAGQSCISTKRIVVEEPIADRFVGLFAQHAGALTVGDPLRRDVSIGPMARPDLRETLHRQVHSTIAQGARLLLGGRYGEGPGFFYAPTLLDHVEPEMCAACEEMLGPAAAVVRVADADAALQVGSWLDFGPGASLWAGDAARAARLASRIESGAVFINGRVARKPRAPFGAIAPPHGGLGPGHPGGGGPADLQNAASGSAR